MAWKPQWVWVGLAILVSIGLWALLGVTLWNIADRPW